MDAPHRRVGLRIREEIVDSPLDDHHRIDERLAALLDLLEPDAERIAAQDGPKQFLVGCGLVEHARREIRLDRALLARLAAFPAEGLLIEAHAPDEEPEDVTGARHLLSL